MIPIMPTAAARRNSRVSALGRSSTSVATFIATSRGGRGPPTTSSSRTLPTRTITSSDSSPLPPRRDSPSPCSSRSSSSPRTTGSMRFETSRRAFRSTASRPSDTPTSPPAGHAPTTPHPRPPPSTPPGSAASPTPRLASALTASDSFSRRTTSPPPNATSPIQTKNDPTPGCARGSRPSGPSRPATTLATKRRRRRRLKSSLRPPRS
mmetsp:Transcript_3355/g.10391  ORF Transcript_3355/g.10391 Transcript_3355/m.10391 type:complete len:208 (-) Transcript_3355:637-1260(-)